MAALLSPAKDTGSLALPADTPGANVSATPRPDEVGVRLSLGPSGSQSSASLVDRTIIVKYRDNITPESSTGVEETGGITGIRSIEGSSWSAVELDPSVDRNAKLEELKALPSIESAEPDRLYHIFYTPNDTYWGYQWNFTQIQADRAWDLSTGAGVTVAVLDTGLRTDGSDAPQNVVAGYNIIANSTDTTDDHGHGTHVTGTIAQRTNNAIGVAGIAYNSTIMPIKICDASGQCPNSAIISGLSYARTHGARVVNLSLGGPDTSVALADAVAQAISAGVVVVAAMGNDGNSVPNYPASYSNVIAVGATRFDQTRASYSNYGNNIWIVAPGGDTSVDQNNDGYVDGIVQQTLGSSCGASSLFSYCFYQGTSMATPHVSGAVALMLARNPSLTVAQIRSILGSTAKNLGSQGWDQFYGNGLVQIYDAVVAAGGSAPTATPTRTPITGGQPTATPTTTKPQTGQGTPEPVQRPRSYIPAASSFEITS
jgi:serine protease